MLSIRKFVAREYNRDQGGGVSFLFHFAVTISLNMPFQCCVSSTPSKQNMPQMCQSRQSTWHSKGFLKRALPLQAHGMQSAFYGGIVDSDMHCIPLGANAWHSPFVDITLIRHSSEHHTWRSG